MALIPTHADYSWFQRKVEVIARLPKVLDAGTSQRFAKDMAPFEPLFSENYKALGYRPANLGPRTCDYDADIHSLPFPEHSWDAVICLDVLEHILDPRLAVSEIHRILKPGGFLLLGAPFLISYHGKTTKGVGTPAHDSYPDYWRFTHEGLALLLRPFQKVEIVPFGGPIGVRLDFLYFDKIALFRSGFIQKVLGKIERPRLGKATARHLAFCTK